VPYASRQPVTGGERRTDDEFSVVYLRASVYSTTIWRLFSIFGFSFLLPGKSSDPFLSFSDRGWSHHGFESDWHITALSLIDQNQVLARSDTWG
jgi:hypothetical protein